MEIRAINRPGDVRQGGAEAQNLSLLRSASRGGLRVEVDRAVGRFTTVSL